MRDAEAARKQAEIDRIAREESEKNTFSGIGNAFAALGL